MLTLAKQLAEIPAARYIALDELRQIETGLTQHYRWSLALANGEAAKCAGCGHAFLLDDLAGGICEWCSENEANFQDIAPSGANVEHGNAVSTCFSRRVGEARHF
jgi:hypothetical protein